MVQQNVQIQNLKPKYIHFKTNGKTPQDRKTVNNAVRFPINLPSYFFEIHFNVYLH